MRASAVFLRSIAMIRRPSATTTQQQARWMTTPVGKKQPETEIVTTVVLEGLEASHLQTILPALSQVLGAPVAKKAVLKHLPPVTESSVVCDSKVSLEGFLNSEMESLHPALQQFVTNGVDGVHEPKADGN